LSAPADPNQAAAGTAGDGGVMVLWSVLKVWKGGKMMQNHRSICMNGGFLAGKSWGILWLVDKILFSSTILGMIGQDD
jgi:hypothetical protein